MPIPGSVRVYRRSVPYDDRPFLVERPDALVARRERCPQIGRKPTSQPRWNLDRWQMVRDLIVGWYGDDRPDAESVPDLVERLAGWADPVQREVVERLFASWRMLYPKDPDFPVNLDPARVSFIDHDARVELRVAPTIAINHPGGEVEYVRIKTGSGRTTREEAAVLHHDPDPGWFFTDAMLATGSAEEIPVPDDGAGILERLVAAADAGDRPELSPGLHCFSCDSAARCGQYPLANRGRIYNSTRALTISKSLLDWMGTCERRVAWDRVFQVPRERDDELEARGGLATGLIFHQMAAAAILSDNPDEVVAAACRESAPSEADDLVRMWENHLRLWEADGRPELRATEVWAGLTVLAPGVRVDSKGREHDEPVAVTFAAALDATGRSVDGRPMVIEHRTGGTGEHGHKEAELYAVAAAMAVHRSQGSLPEAVEVHLHHLRPEEPVCSRSVFDEAALRDAFEALEAVAARAAAWHPLHTLTPRYSVGPWCTGCHHRATCERHRS